MTDADRAYDASQDHQVRLLIAVLVLACLVVYSGSFEGAFVLDDLTHIVQNERLAHGGIVSDLADPRPLTALSLRLNYTLGRAVGGNGLDPLGYHLFNTAVHLGAGLLLFGVVRRSLDRLGHPDVRPLPPAGPTSSLSRRSAAIAFAVALLWLVHPLNTQAVTYVIQRGESMMAMFFLLSIYSLIRGAAEDRRGWYVATVAAAWLSCASKQVAVVLPVVVLLYDRAFLAGTFSAALRQRGWVHGLLAAGSVALILRALMGGADAAPSAGFGMAKYTPLEYALTQPGVILHYLGLSVWPTPLVFDHEWPVATEPAQIVPPLIVLAVLLGATAVALWRWPKVGFVAASFFLVLAPTSSLMPIADLAVEHRMYLPLAAVLTLIGVGAAWVLRRAAGRRWMPVGAAVLALAAVVLGAATYARNLDYRSPERLWRDTVVKAPHNPRAHHNLANVLFVQGRLEEAAEAYRRTLELEPAHAQARVNFGVALLQLGRVEEARSQFEQALEVWPDFSPALHQLGVLHASGGDADAAAAMFRRAIEADPDFADAYIGLGNVNFTQGDSAQAAEAYRHALALRPGDPQVHNNLGISLAQMDQLPEAAAHFEQAVQLDPSFEDARANLQQARRMLAAPEASR